MKIYTKTGDKGQSSLANGERVNKYDARLEAYGTADELNAFIGLMMCHLDSDGTMSKQAEWIQNKLFNLGAALAKAEGVWIETADVEQLEHWIDEMQAEFPPTHAFILPGGNEVASLSHVCRTVTRRLERQLFKLKDEHETDDLDNAIFEFVNRLSDFWFIFSQKCVKNARISCRMWKK